MGSGMSATKLKSFPILKEIFECETCFISIGKICEMHSKALEKRKLKGEKIVSNL